MQTRGCRPSHTACFKEYWAVILPYSGNRCGGGWCGFSDLLVEVVTWSQVVSFATREGKKMLIYMWKCHRHSVCPTDSSAWKTSVSQAPSRRKHVCFLQQIQQGRVTAVFSCPDRVSGERRRIDETSVQCYCIIPVWKGFRRPWSRGLCCICLSVLWQDGRQPHICLFIAEKQHANGLEWPPLHHAAAVAFHVSQSCWGRARRPHGVPKQTVKTPPPGASALSMQQGKGNQRAPSNRDQPKVKVTTVKYCIHACISGAKPSAEPLTPCYTRVNQLLTLN